MMRHFSWRNLTPAALLLGLYCCGMATAEEPVAQSTDGQPQLIWCLDHFARFHHYEDVSTPYGPSVDLMQELARRAGFKLVFTPRTAVARCLRLMAEGKVDLMSNLKFSSARDAIMHLFAYNETLPESLFMRHSDKRSVETKTQLQQLTLVSIRSYLYSPAMMALLAQKQRHVVEVDSIEAGLEMVFRGRVDGLIAPTVSTTNAIDNTAGYAHRFRRADIDLSNGQSSYIHIGLSRLSPHAALAPVLRQEISAMIADGTVARLYAKPTRAPLIRATTN